MVQKVNILSQRLFFSLLPSHKKSVYFFKTFFCYKVLLDLILIFFFKKYKFNLLKFYVGFSKNFFFFNFYVFKNYNLKKNKKSNFCFKIKKNKKFEFFYKNSYVKKWMYYYDSFLKFNSFRFKNYNSFLFLQLKKISSKKILKFNFYKNIFFRLENFYQAPTLNIFTNKNFKSFEFYKNKLAIFWVFFSVSTILLKIQKSRLKIIKFFKRITDFKFIFVDTFFYKSIFSVLALKSFFFKLIPFFFKSKNFYFTGYVKTIINLNPNKNYYFLRKFLVKKKLLFFFLKINLQHFLNQKVKLNLYDSFALLNKFNKFEFFLNVILVKKNYFKFLNFYKLQKNHRYLFLLNFIKILFLSLRLKSFGYFLQLVCNEIGTFKKQWLAIKKIKKLIETTSLKTINFFGFHLLISGTIQGRLRTTRFHIFKNLQPSIYNFNFETHYLYKKSFSVYGVLGIKLWVYY